jgi:hypothetical protein
VGSEEVQTVDRRTISLKLATSASESRSALQGTVRDSVYRGMSRASWLWSQICSWPKETGATASAGRRGISPGGLRRCGPTLVAAAQANVSLASDPHASRLKRHVHGCDASQS